MSELSKKEKRVHFYETQCIRI